MMVTTFRIDNPKYFLAGNAPFQRHDAFYKIPILPAYAVIDSQLEMSNSMHIDAGYIPPTYELEEDGVVTQSNDNNYLKNVSGILTIYHNGIKDYELLFPHIEDVSLKKRLGQFAEEAEKAFSNQSWISYCLMVGSVLEGLLFNEFGNRKFSELIRCAKNRDLITEQEANLINNVRETRNQIHANRHNEIIVGRKTALEISTAYDKLIKRHWRPKTAASKSN